MSKETDNTPDGFDARPLLKSLTHKPGAYQMLDSKHRVMPARFFAVATTRRLAG